MNPKEKIEIEHLSVKFGSHFALEDISFELEKGSFLTVIGPNGGGKSTFLKILLGLLSPSEGKVRIFAKSPSEIPAEWIGYVPQIKTLDRSFPALSIELVASGILGTWPGIIKKGIRDEALQSLEKVGASKLAFRSIGTLSGGELQRVYLARSFVRQPKILLLDEPSTGIDISGEKDISNIMEDYRREYGATIIMVTHDWESAYHHADKALIINRHVICFNIPSVAFAEENIRRAFGHIGHKHKIIFSGGLHA